MKSYEHTGNTFEIRCRTYHFTNDWEVVCSEFTAKEAKKTVKLLEEQPAYRGCEFKIFQTMKNWERIYTNNEIK